MLRDSVVVVVVRTRPRAIPLAMITMKKSTHGFPFVSHIWVAYGAPLGSPSGRRSSAINVENSVSLCCLNFRHFVLETKIKIDPAMPFLYESHTFCRTRSKLRRLDLRCQSV